MQKTPRGEAPPGIEPVVSQGFFPTIRLSSGTGKLFPGFLCYFFLFTKITHLLAPLKDLVS